MKINSINSNCSFGKLNIDSRVEKALYSEILYTPKDEQTLKEIILDVIEVQKSPNNNVTVFSGGNVEVESEWTKGASFVGGRNLLERFETALRAARSDKYQEFLTDKKENPFFDVQG